MGYHRGEKLKDPKYTKTRWRFTHRGVFFYFPLRVSSAGGHQAQLTFTDPGVSTPMIVACASRRGRDPHNIASRVTDKVP